MKKKGIIILLLLIAIISYGHASINKEYDQEVISRAFEESMSNFESLTTNYNGKLSDEFLNLKRLEELTKKYLHILNIEEIDREVVEETNMNQISIYGQGESGENITLILYSYIDEDENGETTVFIDISGYENHEKVEENSSKISKILEKQDIKAETTSCIVGTYDGKLRSEYKMGIIEDLIKSTKSREIESLVDDSVMSYSLYSKDIDNYIYSGKEKVNLNIAIRYNEYEDETYIFIASPIITMGY